MDSAPSSSLERLSGTVEKAVRCLRELKTENVHLKEEIRRLEREVEQLREELGVKGREEARLRQARVRIRMLAQRVLDHLASIENSGDEIDVTS